MVLLPLQKQALKTACACHTGPACEWLCSGPWPHDGVLAVHAGWRAYRTRWPGLVALASQVPR